MLEGVKRNNITQVGYEIELDSSSYREEDIAKELQLNFKDFKYIKGHNIGIKMSSEYYRSTIEFNFMKEPFKKNLHNKVKKFTNFVINKFGLIVFGNSPSYVGTHIHFFRSGLNIKSPDTILKILLQFLIENLDDLNLKSIERIVCSHQLWGNYAINNPLIGDVLKNVLGKEFAYPDICRRKTKYRPVVHSPRSSTGKLRSTEIRLIPTELLLNDKVLILIERLIAFDNIPNEDVESLYFKIVTHYKGLIEKQKKND